MADSIDLRKQKLEQQAKDAQTALDQSRANVVNLRKQRDSLSLFDKNRAALNQQITSAKNLSKENKSNVANSQADLTREIDAQKNRDMLMTDLAEGEALAGDVLGDAANLGRIRDDQAVIDARKAYSDATDLSMMRDSATRKLQNAEGSASRQLQSQLSAAGVKGGLAGGAMTDLAALNLRNRAALEQDLAIQNVQANKERAQFETQLAEFDLGQANAENNLRLQAKIGIAQHLQSSRSASDQRNAADDIGSSGSGGGTVLCTAMYHHGFISADDFYCDIEAGRKLLASKQTRKAFLLYNRSCKPIANFAIKNRWFAYVLKPLIVPVAKSFRDNNRLGKTIFATLSVPFKLLSKVL